MQGEESKKPEKMKLSGHDQGVMQTSNDALATKVYASDLGYFKDDFSKLFLQRKRKMYPIINRGTWARVQSYRQVIMKFLQVFQACDNVNIISLGCGYDVTYYWLLQLYPELREKLSYVEIDYDRVVNQKIEVIKKNGELHKIVAGDTGLQCDYEIDLPKYKLFACDVRNTEQMSQKLQQMYGDQYADFKRSPTLVLTECLLIYLKAADTQKILKWCNTEFQESPFLSLLNYEMINPNDNFGQMMVDNLKDRGCELLGFDDCPDLNAQILRIESNWDPTVEVHALDMFQVYQKSLDTAEKQRIEKLEIFDEFEEWQLLQSHYCLVLAKRFTDATQEMASNICI